MQASFLLLAAAGGALGSVARAVVARVIPTGLLPWGTVVANVSGSLLIGVLMARLAAAPAESVRAQAFWVIGFCGGYTTFSSFSWQTLEQLHRGEVGTALLHVAASVTLCLLATWIGWRIAR